MSVALVPLTASTCPRSGPPRRHRRPELLIGVENDASKRVAERNGYRFEGVLRSLHFKLGVREDTEIWSRLPDD